MTGQLINAERATLWTLVGAVCFLIGAVLLLPERTEDISAAEAASGNGRASGGEPGFRM